jgi:hypothetical protein
MGLRQRPSRPARHGGIGEIRECTEVTERASTPTSSLVRNSVSLTATSPC